ncbi:hypothetical protein BGZ74_003068 [Mortierella antarctica]|nr:hypothetical protein BGZ74_003068 [Mortierella antarctica]
MLTSSLPHELLVKIFYNLETRPQHRHSSTSSISFSSSLSLERADILSCALVCQDWYYAAVDTLWRDVDLQSVESFIHFSQALEPSFSYIGGTLRGSSCDDDIGEDEDNDMEACPIGSDERHSRNTQRIVRQEGKEVTRGAINITRSASTTRSTCPSTYPGPAHPSEISSSSNSGLSSFSSSLSTSVSSLSSLSHGPSPGQVGFAGKGYVRTLSLAGSTDCQAPRPFPYLPSCITDRHLSSLSPSLTHLTSLNLAHCSAISDVSVIYIVTSSSPYLKKIDLTECRLITNLTIQVIARLCSQLEEISLQGCGLIRDDAIEELALYCTRLQKIDIGQCQRASDRAVLALLTSSGQVNAGPNGGLYAPSSLGVIVRTRNARISRLGIAGCRGVTMIALMAIGEHLSPDPMVTDNTNDDGHHSEDASSLLSLEFTCPSPVPRTHVQNAQGHHNQNLSSPARRIFRSLPTTLEEISIHDAHHLNHDDILCLVQRVGLTLKTLRLDNGNAVTSDTLTYILGACPKLTVLCIPRATRLDDTGVIQLASARCATTLVELDLSACRNLTDACLTRLALASRDIATSSISTLSHDIKGKSKGESPQEPPCLFPNLRRLDLSYNGKLTLTGIIPLVMSLKNLCALDVSFCGDGVTTAWSSSLETLRESLNPTHSQPTPDQGCASSHSLSSLPSVSPSSQHQPPPPTPVFSIPLQNMGANEPLAPPPASTLTFTTTGTVPWRRGLGRYVGPMLSRPAQDNTMIPQHPQQHPGQGTNSATASLDISRRRFSNPGAYPTEDGDKQSGSSNSLNRRFSAPSASSSSSYSLASTSSFLPYSPPIHLAGRPELLEQTPRRVGILASFHLESWFTPLHQHQLQQLFQMQVQQQHELQMQVAEVANQGLPQQNQVMQASALASAAASAAVLPPEMMVHPVMSATRVGVATIGGSTASTELFGMGGDDLDTVHGTSRQTTTGGRRSSNAHTLNSGDNGSRRSLVSAKIMTSGHCEVSGWGLSKLREEWGESITWA